MNLRVLGAQGSDAFSFLAAAFSGSSSSIIISPYEGISHLRQRQLWILAAAVGFRHTAGGVGDALHGGGGVSTGPALFGIQTAYIRMESTAQRAVLSETQSTVARVRLQPVLLS